MVIKSEDYEQETKKELLNQPCNEFHKDPLGHINENWYRLRRIHDRKNGIQHKRASNTLKK